MTGSGGKPTDRFTVVVLARGLPVTVIGNVPVGVPADVVMVSWVEHVGLQALVLNPRVAPAGSPEVSNATLWVAPAVSVAVIVVEPAPPWATTMFPEFTSE